MIDDRMLNKNASNSEMKDQISIFSIKIGMKVGFISYDDSFLKGEVTDIYTSPKDDSIITGCTMITEDGTPYALYAEDNPKIFLIQKNEASNIEIKKESVTDKTLEINSKNEKKNIMENKDKIEEKPRKVLANIFSNSEIESSNAKFPDWDIVPPNQFINPRLRQN